MQSQLCHLQFPVNYVDKNSFFVGFIGEKQINLIKQTKRPHDNKQSLSINMGKCWNFGGMENKEQEKKTSGLEAKIPQESFVELVLDNGPWRLENDSWLRFLRVFH